MSTAPILFVAGFGRCGTTMVMTMLDRGGFPVAGPRPAYEAPEMGLGRVDHAWVRAQAGRAVKWIDPLKAVIRPADLQETPAIILYLRRNLREQAASQVKMAAPFGFAVNDRYIRRAFQASLRREAPALHRHLVDLGPVYTLDYEEILQDPRGAANLLKGVVYDHFDLPFDFAAAARVPIRRSPKCAPDLSFELQLAGWVA